MIYEPWHFVPSVVPHPAGGHLLRLALRNKAPISNDKHYVDLDISGKVQTALGKDTLLPKATAFVRSLGFHFPIPINVKAAHTIFSFQAFPSWDVWERLGRGDYKETDYRADASRWYIQKLHIRSHVELWKRTGEKFSRLRNLEPLDRPQRARVIETLYRWDLESLEAFYGFVTPPENVELMLHRLHELALSHRPAPKVNKRKVKSSPSGDIGERVVQQMEW